MMWTRPEGSFEIQPWPLHEPAYRTDFEKKRLFGVALAKGLKPFEAACEVFGNDTQAALWVSQNWPHDPIALEASKTEEKNLKLLDKEALADKVLSFVNERDPSGRFFVNESKDRIAALKLYAEICGYIGKVEIDASTKNFDNRTMNIRLVKPDKKEEELKTITVQPEMVDSGNVVPLKVKLVG